MQCMRVAQALPALRCDLWPRLMLASSGLVLEQEPAQQQLE